jgi:eukaryotic-like serine/threonine-protein kinase
VRSFTVAILVVALAAIYMVVQVGFVIPRQWPAGHGVLLSDEARPTTARVPPPIVLSRPPAIAGGDTRVSIVREVVPGSPAALAGLNAGDVILAIRNVTTGASVDLSQVPTGGTSRILAWRDAYRLGVDGPFELTFVRARVEETVRVESLPAWATAAPVFAPWVERHLARQLQIVVFIAISALLLALRASNRTAVLAVLALTMSAVGTGGPLMGAESLLPRVLGDVLLLFAWIAVPLGFIAVAFAMLYFPREADILVRRPALKLAPFAITAPMLLLSAADAFFLMGADAALPLVTWDASHPWLYFMSFTAACAMNVFVVAEGYARFRRNPDVAERRRIEILVLTVVPGVAAYALKDGLPALSVLAGVPMVLPWWMALALQVVVLLPAFGLAYVVAVHRVFSPATVVRRSIQYALARRTLAVLAMLPAIALAGSLVRNRDMSIAMLVSGRPIFYLLMTAAFVVTLRYRDRARRWLDRRFFREAYDAREILLSLASRLTYETDPADLTAMVVDRIDTALHPEMAAVMVAGLQEGVLEPVSVVRGSAPALPMESGLVTMLRWSPEPLQLYVSDERSPTRRLPQADQDWLRQTGAVLFVPVFVRAADGLPPGEPGSDPGSLVAIVALGARRSEEPYTAEDRQLLASIAAQMALALDVARLRQRSARVQLEAGRTQLSASADASSRLGLQECPECGRCAAPDVAICPNDGATMQPVRSVPHIIERKYRIDQVVGRGGMGAVYRARDERLDRDVAIKVVRAELLHDPGARSRFRREAQIVARLQHPGIVSVFDYGTLPDGGAFLVMELVRGDDLRRVLRRDGPMPASRVLPLVAAMCAAVQAAHRDGVLHRDLKPENILLVEGEAPVKVLDFGVAKLVADGAVEETGLGALTGAGVVLGTPAYMAPEQLRSAPVDARADIFSLGVIAYEMLTGELPFGRTSIWDIGVRQIEGMRPFVSPHGPLPSSLQDAIERALSLDPSRRPRTAADFANQIQAAII